MSDIKDMMDVGLSKKEALLEMICNDQVFNDGRNKGFVTVSKNNHFETYAIRSSQFRNLLSSIYYAEIKSSISKHPLQETLDTLEAKAVHEGVEHKVFFRIAELNGNLYVDLGDSDYSIIKITPNGWDVCNAADVKFTRTNAMQPLPMPMRGGNINDFRKFVNVASDEDFKLLLAWILSAFKIDNMPYPVLIVQGEQGTGKTFLCDLVRSLIDSSSTSLRTMPKNERDLIVSASNNHVLAFDNLSGISNELSDALCRISTGGGFTSRQLYSDGDEFVMDVRRPQIVNGIDDIALKPDLNERAVILNLPNIDPANRKSTAELRKDFESMRPYIMGAIFDALVVGLNNIKTIELHNKPRMADFAVWIAAMEVHLGWGAGGFMQAYDLNREASIEAAIENNILIQTIIRMLESYTEFKGTVLELLNKLKISAPNGYDIRRDHMWPKNPTVLSRELRRIAPQLRHIKIACDFIGKTNKGRIVAIRKTE